MRNPLEGAGDLPSVIEFALRPPEWTLSVDERARSRFGSSLYDRGPAAYAELPNTSSNQLVQQRLAAMFHGPVHFLISDDGGDQQLHCSVRKAGSGRQRF